mmetsp:Transcript_65882/g.201747  ORF Transcript_65882/g.201747 Transcript_65882/m.201747 type:complete len:212 (-) Transcript_65882:565-1200(-)
MEGQVGDQACAIGSSLARLQKEIHPADVVRYGGRDELRVAQRPGNLHVLDPLACEGLGVVHDLGVTACLASIIRFVPPKNHPAHAVCACWWQVDLARILDHGDILCAVGLHVRGRLPIVMPQPTKAGRLRGGSQLHAVPIIFCGPDCGETAEGNGTVGSLQLVSVLLRGNKDVRSARLLGVLVRRHGIFRFVVGLGFLPRGLIFVGIVRLV